jgi:2-iminobutanoate/2-iminopropanoate deaminase
MAGPEAINAGIAHQIGRYADAVRIPAGMDQVVVSGTPGLVWPGFLVEIEVTAAVPAR